MWLLVVASYIKTRNMNVKGRKQGRKASRKEERRQAGRQATRQEDRQAKIEGSKEGEGLRRRQGEAMYREEQGGFTIPGSFECS